MGEKREETCREKDGSERCHRPVFVRGVCQTHYRRAVRIEQGRATVAMNAPIGTLDKPLWRREGIRIPPEVEEAIEADLRVEECWKCKGIGELPSKPKRVKGESLPRRKADGNWECNHCDGKGTAAQSFYSRVMEILEAYARRRRSTEGVRQAG